MEIKDWISLASACIVAFGWFVTGYLNRVKDVAQKRLEYRLNALEAFLPVWFSIQKSGGNPFNETEFLTKLEHSRSLFQLYGLDDEIEFMEQFISSLEKQSLPEANLALSKLVPLVRSRIRTELKISYKLKDFNLTR
ncbi:hypothetical protein [Methylophilus aquaticus]|uniref:Uncharacterized protein n=1 Tax=Methylophilus aquaticus TaxID=1971610 RepID=A0ABT9JRQ4_9PROT|nr:hypothetical protein [Methylophilus aquaticus]MDP8567256.1 hypothetical protein [Methylophilus aquaticus]